MAKTPNRTHKHFQAAKVKCAKKVLTETETIDLALDLAIAELQKNHLTLGANERFVKSGSDIKDLYGLLSG